MAALLRSWQAILLAYLAVTADRAVLLDDAVPAPHPRDAAVAVERCADLVRAPRRPVDGAGAGPG